MESIIFTTDASLVLAELLGGVRHEDLFIVADKHTVGFCDRLFEKVDWIPSHENQPCASLSRGCSGLRGRV